MNAYEKVLAKHPNAQAIPKGFEIKITSEVFFPVEKNGFFGHGTIKTIGRGLSEYEAWIDAANKLEEMP